MRDFQLRCRDTFNWGIKRCQPCCCPHSVCRLSFFFTLTGKNFFLIRPYYDWNPCLSKEKQVFTAALPRRLWFLVIKENSGSNRHSTASWVSTRQVNRFCPTRLSKRANSSRPGHRTKKIRRWVKREEISKTEVVHLIILFSPQIKCCPLLKSQFLLEMLHVYYSQHLLHRLYSVCYIFLNHYCTNSRNPPEMTGKIRTEILFLQDIVSSSKTTCTLTIRHVILLCNYFEAPIDQKDTLLYNHSYPSIRLRLYSSFWASFGERLFYLLNYWFSVPALSRNRRCISSCSEKISPFPFARKFLLVCPSSTYCLDSSYWWLVDINSWFQSESKEMEQSRQICWPAYEIIITFLYALISFTLFSCYSVMGIAHQSFLIHFFAFILWTIRLVVHLKPFRRLWGFCYV